MITIMYLYTFQPDVEANQIVLSNTHASIASALPYVQQTVAVVAQTLNVTESTIKLYASVHLEG